MGYFIRAQDEPVNERKSFLDYVRGLFHSRNYAELERIMGKADAATLAFRRAVNECGFAVTTGDMHISREGVLEILSSPETRRILAGTGAHGPDF